jgi:hypothetical protein
MLALLSLGGLLVVIWLLIKGEFQMPSNTLFYAFWVALVLLTEISFTLFLVGMLKTSFFAAISFGNVLGAILIALGMVLFVIKSANYEG